MCKWPKWLAWYLIRNGQEKDYSDLSNTAAQQLSTTETHIVTTTSVLMPPKEDTSNKNVDFINIVSPTTSKESHTRKKSPLSRSSMYVCEKMTFTNG
jgi:hypothetical protein